MKQRPALLSRARPASPAALPFLLGIFFMRTSIVEVVSVRIRIAGMHTLTRTKCCETGMTAILAFGIDRYLRLDPPYESGTQVGRGRPLQHRCARVHTARHLRGSMKAQRLRMNVLACLWAA